MKKPPQKAWEGESEGALLLTNHGAEQPQCARACLSRKSSTRCCARSIWWRRRPGPRGACRAGSDLHRADYDRKPRGGPEGLPAYVKRASFCCQREGCRRRRTPPSVRFLGRRVYLATVVVLVAVLRHGLSPGRVDWLHRVLGVSRRTLGRWRTWWKLTFVQTRCWREVRGRIVPAVDEEGLPRSLWDRLAGEWRARLLLVLRLLSPVTASPGCDLVRRS